MTTKTIVNSVVKSAEDVAWRGICLWMISLRAQAEHGLVNRGHIKGRAYRRLARSLKRQVQEQGVLEKFSPRERALFRTRTGGWPDRDISEKFWRIESLKTALWAGGVLVEMPDIARVGDVSIYYNLLQKERDLRTYARKARLRPLAEINFQRARFRFFHWRCRIELHRLHGTQLPERGPYSTYAGGIARFIKDYKRDLLPEDHDGRDILVEGVRLRDLPGETLGDVLSICKERHLTLEWIMSGVGWDGVQG